MQGQIDKTMNRTHDGVVTANFKNQDEYIDQQINVEDIDVQDNKKVDNNTIFKSFENEDKQCVNSQCAQIVDAYNNAWMKKNNNESPIKSDNPEVKLAAEDEDLLDNIEEARKTFVEFYQQSKGFYEKSGAIGAKIFKIVNKYVDGQKKVTYKDVEKALRLYYEHKGIIKSSCCDTFTNFFKKPDQAKIERNAMVKADIAEILASNNQAPNNEKWVELVQNQQPDIGGISNSKQ